MNYRLSMGKALSSQHRASDGDRRWRGAWFFTLLYYHYYYLCVLLAVFPLISAAFDDENWHFDPDLAEQRTVDVPAAPSSAGPPDPSLYCTGSALWPTDDQLLDQIALVYAPVLFFHPLETFTLASVRDTFADPEQGRLYLQQTPPEYYDEEVITEDELYWPSLDLKALLNSSVDRELGFLKQDYFLQRTKLTEAVVAGAGFESAKGSSRAQQSRAPIYYHAHPWNVTLSNSTSSSSSSSSSAWVFHYYFYYNYRGANTLGILTSRSSSSNVTTHFYAAQIPPYGEHEGDWQSMSVMICPLTVTNITNTTSLALPLAVSYQQHAYRQVTDCTQGECTLFRDSVHPVGFVARHSHATFPIPAQWMLLQEFTTDFFINVQGVFWMDQTIYTSHENNSNSETLPSYRYFMPNHTNVIRHDDPVQINFNATNISDYWQGFAGRWGGSGLYPATSNETAPICNNGTDLIDCPSSTEDPAFYSVMQMLQVYPSNPDDVAASALTLSNQVNQTWTPATAVGPRGPATRADFSSWVPPIPVPFRTQVNFTMSNFESTIQSIRYPYREAAQVDQIALQQNAVGMLVLCIMIVVVNTICYTHPRLRGEPRSPLDFDERGVVQRPNWRLLLWICRPALFYVASYLVTMVGLGLYLAGYADLLVALEQTLGVDLSGAKLISQFFGVSVLIIDTLMAVIVWLPIRALWIQVNAAYYDLIGDEVQFQKFKKRIWCGARISGFCFTVMYGVLYNSFIVATLCVLIGCVDVGIASTAGQICKNLVGAVNGVCFNLYQWGITVDCGPEFANFCNKLATTASVVTLWGSILVVAGQYYLMGSAGAAASQMRSLPYSLHLLPCREIYQEKIVRVHDEEPLPELTDSPPAIY